MPRNSAGTCDSYLPNSPLSTSGEEGDPVFCPNVHEVINTMETANNIALRTIRLSFFIHTKVKKEARCQRDITQNNTPNTRKTMRSKYRIDCLSRGHLCDRKATILL